MISLALSLRCAFFFQNFYWLLARLLCKCVISKALLKQDEHYYYRGKWRHSHPFHILLLHNSFVLQTELRILSFLLFYLIFFVIYLPLKEIYFKVVGTITSVIISINIFDDFGRTLSAWQLSFQKIVLNVLTK